MAATLAGKNLGLWAKQAGADHDYWRRLTPADANFLWEFDKLHYLGLHSYLFPNEPVIRGSTCGQTSG